MVYLGVVARDVGWSRGELRVLRGGWSVRRSAVLGSWPGAPSSALVAHHQRLDPHAPLGRRSVRRRAASHRSPARRSAGCSSIHSEEARPLRALWPGTGFRRVCSAGPVMYCRSSNRPTSAFGSSRGRRVCRADLSAWWCGGDHKRDRARPRRAASALCGELKPKETRVALRWVWPRRRRARSRGFSGISSRTEESALTAPRSDRPGLNSLTRTHPCAGRSRPRRSRVWPKWATPGRTTNRSEARAGGVGSGQGACGSLPS